MAEALRCNECGASLPTTTPDVASVPCPSCGSVNRIAGELLEALHTHHRRVGDYRGQGERASEHAVLSQVTGSFGRGWAGLFVVSWLLAAVAMMPETPVAYMIGTAVFLGPFVAMFVLGRRRLRRFTAEAAAIRASERARRIAVHCPTCGGQSELLPDAPVLPCRYCSGALAADEAALAELIDVARASAEREQRIALEQRWRLAARTNRDQRTDLVPLFVIGGLGGLVVLASISAAIRGLFVSGGPALGELSLMSAIGLLMIAAPGLPLWIRRRRRLEALARFETLAARTSAALSRDLLSFSVWLVTHWTGELASRRICAGLGYVFIAASSGTNSSAWALSLAPEAQANGPVERHLRVLIPGHASGSFVRDFAARLEPLGFGIEPEAGGLIASLPASELDGFIAADASVERLAEALSATR